MEKGKKYQHQEAFAFMYYGNSSAIEPRGFWAFNSRDGVTPVNYIINGIEYIHAAHNHDWRNPDYQPKTGDFVFRDRTPEEVKESAKRRIKSFDGSKFEIKEGEEGYETALEQISDQYLRIPVLYIVDGPVFL